MDKSSFQVIREISYQLNKVKLEELYTYLSRRDQEFTPSLSSRMDVYAFAKKIYSFAHIYSAHLDQILGVCAVYANDFDTKEAYITNMSIHPDYYGSGLAEKLMNFSLDNLRDLEFRSIKLEVAKNNQRAIEFYHKMNFTVTKESSANGYYMIRSPL